MKTVSKEELEKILENHRHWVGKDRDGWETMQADLSNVDLSWIKVVEALEKQTPKKPKITIHNGYCGNCGCAWGRERLVQEEYCGYKYFQYCPVCGTKIDWGEGE